MSEITTRVDALKQICWHRYAGGRLILFLDYDGTLVPIAATPDEARPDSSLLELLEALAQVTDIQTVILSGCCLADLEGILPIPGLTLAGTYGVEIKQEAAVTLRGEWVGPSRPLIAQVRLLWEALIPAGQGFLLEDKGCAVALHARWAEPDEAERVLVAARTAATDLIHAGRFKMHTGPRFLEVAPETASKKQAVHWFLSRIRKPSTLPVYFGDDERDDDAFDAIRQWGGVSRSGSAHSV